jgi:hypothetical protein
MRRTLVIAMVTGSLMIGGTSAVLAGGDGQTTGDDAGKGQYGCPPNTKGSHCKPKTCQQNGSTANGQNCTPKGSHGSHQGGGSHGNNGKGSHKSHG